MSPILLRFLRCGFRLLAKFCLLVFIRIVLLDINNTVTGLLKSHGTEVADKLPSRLYAL